VQRIVLTITAVPILVETTLPPAERVRVPDERPAEQQFCLVGPRLRLLRQVQTASQLSLDGVRLDVPSVLGFCPPSLGASATVRLSKVASLT
jgi:hypothetical protein